MAGLVTRETDKSVSAFIESIENPRKKADAETLLALLTEVTGEEPKIWGDNFIVGFGKYTYQRKGSKEDHEWFNIGFAPRKKNLTVYLTYDIGQEEELLARLGKCTWGKGCLYINKLADVDLDVLREILTKGKDSGWR